ncbi:hypothetical protein ACS0TY_022399 [Phlomoides rotata]
MVVKAKVIVVDSFGAIVQLASSVKALCPLRHMSEFEIAKPRKKFQVGIELVFRVLGGKSKRITVTHKKTLVKSKLDILSSSADATEGLVTHGWITKIEDHGCFVRFYNGEVAVKRFMNQDISGDALTQLKCEALLFVTFNKEKDAFEAKYKNVATLYKGKGISFMFGDADVTQNAFQYFGLKPEQAPLLIIQTKDGQKYLKANIEPDQIESWVKDYKEGLLKPFIRSEPIPEVNNEPVKVVVRDSLQDVVFNSGKNVLLEFYAPWCGHCKSLAPILDEVAISFEKDPNVLIAKFDATANDVPSDTFDVQGFPTMYFKSASGKLSQFEGDRTKEGIINFIETNRDDKPSQSTSAKTESTKSESVDEDVKDEL